MSFELIGQETPTDKYLYHYTKLETVLENILPTAKIKLGPITRTNDPRESKVWFFNYHALHNINHKDIDKIQLPFNLSLRQGIKVLCLSMDFPEKPNSIYYGRGYQRPRMWAQYAENHRGACLVFRKDLILATASRELSKDGSLFSGPVAYTDKDEVNMDEPFSLNYDECLSKGIEQLANNMVSKHYKAYFFRKHVDWIQEQEFRIVLRTEDNYPRYITITDSLEAIILGVDFPQAYEPLIQGHCKHYNIYYARMKWWNGFPNIHVYQV